MAVERGLLAPVRCAVRARDEDRALPLAEVVPGRLAGHGRVTEHPEHVVAKLERLPERYAVLGVRPGQRGTATGERTADLQRPLDGVLRALVADDPQRFVDRP